jgi:DNA polymerase-4
MFSHEPPVRRILHVDMDAFYASVEQRDRPELRGKPVAVGGRPASRGVVCAASYEARVHGVRSAIPMSRAVRLCPDLIVVPPDFQKYRDASQQVFEIFRSVTPLVEGLSLDEAYLDVTVNHWGETLGVEVARRIKREIRERTGLTASAGVAPNKFLAKIASGWRKPDGLTVIAPERMEAFLQQLPIDALWGVGPVTAKRLRAHGIDRLVDVRAASAETLQAAVGSQAGWLTALAWGRDDRRVVSHRIAKSNGAERTYNEDLRDLAVMHAQIDKLSRLCGEWVERKSLRARTVTLKVRYDDFTTVTRSISVTGGVGDIPAIAEHAHALLERTDAATRPVRLLGVSVHNLVDPSETQMTGDDVLPFEDTDA